MLCMDNMNAYADESLVRQTPFSLKGGITEVSVNIPDESPCFSPTGTTNIYGDFTKKSFKSSCTSSLQSSSSSSPFHRQKLSRQESSMMFNANNNKSKSKISANIYYTPILLGMLPYLLGCIFGYSEVWMEISVIILILFWLHFSLKAPWEIYFIVMKKVHQTSSKQIAPSTTPALITPSETEQSPVEPGKKLVDAGFFSQMSSRMVEYLAMLLVFLAPFISIYGITFFKAYYPDFRTVNFLSLFNIHLFLLAALIPTFKYFSEKRSSYIELNERPPRLSRGSVSNNDVDEDLNGRLQRLEEHISKDSTTSVSPETSSLIKFHESLENIEKREEFFYHDVLQRFESMERNLRLLQKHPSTLSLSKQLSLLKSLLLLMVKGICYSMLLPFWPWIISLKYSLRFLKNIIKNIG